MAEEDLVRSEDSQGDELAKTINDRLMSDAGLDRKIQVHVSGHEATLTGDVDSPEERDRAEAIVVAVPGSATSSTICG